VPGIRELADALCAALAAFEPGRYSAEDCADLAERLARTGRTCETASARAAATAAKSGAHRDRGHASAAEWLARAAGAPSGRARSALETLEAVEACPDTKDALIAGELSLDQASEIARLPEHEAELLDVARHRSLRALKDEARRLRLESMDPDDLHSRQRERRELRHWVDDELGLVRFAGAFSPEFGKRFANRLDRETDRVWRDARHERRKVTRAQCAADAFERLFSGMSSTKAGTTDLMFVCDLNAWARGHAHPGEVAHIVGGGPSRSR
jgi:hypothetical protein